MVNMGGQSKCELITPPIGFQCTHFYIVCGLKFKAILYNSVNEDDMWKGIVNSVHVKGKLLNLHFTPQNENSTYRISTF